MGGSRTPRPTRSDRLAHPRPTRSDRPTRSPRPTRSDRRPATGARRPAPGDYSTPAKAATATMPEIWSPASPKKRVRV